MVSTPTVSENNPAIAMMMMMIMMMRGLITWTCGALTWTDHSCAQRTGLTCLTIVTDVTPGTLNADTLGPIGGDVCSLVTHST